MNVEIEAEAALFPEKEYIKGILVAVYLPLHKGKIWHKLSFSKGVNYHLE
jgi:hypothetical protein